MVCNIPFDVLSLGAGSESFNGTVNIEWKGQSLVKMHRIGLVLEQVREKLGQKFSFLFSSVRIRVR